MMEPPLKLARTIMRQSDVTIVVSHRWKSDQLRPLFVCHLDPVPSRSSFLFLRDSRRERGIETGLGETFHSANRSPCVVGKVYNGLIYISRGYLPPSFLPFGRTRYFRSLILKLTRLGGVFLSLCLSLSLFLSLLFSLFSSLSAKDEQGNINRIRNTFDAQCDTTLSPVCRMCLFITRRNGCLRRFTYFYDPTCF